MLYLLLVVDVPLNVVEAPVVPVPHVLHYHLVLELPPDEGRHQLALLAPALPAQVKLSDKKSQLSRTMGNK